MCVKRKIMFGVIKGIKGSISSYFVKCQRRCINWSYTRTVFNYY